MTEQDDYLVDAILCHKELALAHDTIRIALKTAGYSNVDSMNQFERASAILDMAQELTGFRVQSTAYRIDDYLYSHRGIA